MHTTRLATCSYREYRPSSETAAVRITRTPPAPGTLTYTIDAARAELAPPRELEGRRVAAFEAGYRDHLEHVGFDAIADNLHDTYKALGGRVLVLLSFEVLVQPDAYSHRRMFADWWEEHTGRHVPEAGRLPRRHPAATQPGLFTP